MVHEFSIKFGSLGDYQQWVMDGWHHDASERDYTWMSSLASLRLTLGRVRTPLRLEIDIIPQGMDQDLFIYLNGNFVTFQRVTASTVVTAAIHPLTCRPGENILALVCPRAYSAQQIGKGGDVRVLGAAVRSLAVMEL